MSGKLQHYFRKFSNLTRGVSTKYANLSATKKRAPHKPLMLLAVLDLFATGQLTGNFITFTDELDEEFNRYWELVMGPDDQTTLALPFYHLASEGFWHLVPRAGDEDDMFSTTPSSMSQLQKISFGARLDGDLFQLLRETQHRQALRQVLIESYFSQEMQEKLYRVGARAEAEARSAYPAGRLEYHKLVRDRIPEIIEADGRSYRTRELTLEDYRQALLQKLVEEAEEAAAPGADLLKELADVREVLDALVRAFDVDPAALQAKQAERRRERGDFERRLELLWVEGEEE